MAKQWQAVAFDDRRKPWLDGDKSGDCHFQVGLGFEPRHSTCLTFARIDRKT